MRKGAHCLRVETLQTMISGQFAAILVKLVQLFIYCHQTQETFGPNQGDNKVGAGSVVPIVKQKHTRQMHRCVFAFILHAIFTSCCVSSHSQVYPTQGTSRESSCVAHRTRVPSKNGCHGSYFTRYPRLLLHTRKAIRYKLRYKKLCKKER